MGLKSLRTEKSITQKKIAEALGITISYYSLLERNPEKIKPEFASGIASVLGCSLETLHAAEPNIATKKKQDDAGPAKVEKTDSKVTKEAAKTTKKSTSSNELEEFFGYAVIELPHSELRYPISKGTAKTIAGWYSDPQKYCPNEIIFATLNRKTVLVKLMHAVVLLEPSDHWLPNLPFSLWSAVSDALTHQGEEIKGDVSNLKGSELQRYLLQEVLKPVAPKERAEIHENLMKGSFYETDGNESLIDPSARNDEILRGLLCEYDQWIRVKFVALDFDGAFDDGGTLIITGLHNVAVVESGCTFLEASAVSPKELVELVKPLPRGQLLELFGYTDAIVKVKNTDDRNVLDTKALLTLLGAEDAGQ